MALIIQTTIRTKQCGSFHEFGSFLPADHRCFQKGWFEGQINVEWMNEWSGMYCAGLCFAIIQRNLLTVWKTELHCQRHGVLTGLHQDRHRPVRQHHLCVQNRRGLVMSLCWSRLFNHEASMAFRQISINVIFSLQGGQESHLQQICSDGEWPGGDGALKPGVVCFIHGQWCYYCSS